MIGVVFTINSLTALVSAQAYSCLSNKSYVEEYAIPIGLLLSSASFALAGPMYPIPLQGSYVFVIARLLLLGMSTVPQIRASLTIGLKETNLSGFTDDIRTKAAFTALYNTALGIG